jgi:hypothetical protein
MRLFLEKFEVKYEFLTPIPEPCTNRLLYTPENPTDIRQLGMILVIGVLAVAVAVVTVYIVKKMIESDKRKK